MATEGLRDLSGGRSTELVYILIVFVKPAELYTVRLNCTDCKLYLNLKFEKHGFLGRFSCRPSCSELRPGAWFRGLTPCVRMSAGLLPGDTVLPTPPLCDLR